VDLCKPLVDGPASAACLSQPMGCALSPQGGALYVADSLADRIRRVAALTPAEVRAAARVFAAPPSPSSGPCFCMTTARIYVASSFRDAGDGRQGVIQNMPSSDIEPPLSTPPPLTRVSLYALTPHPEGMSCPDLSSSACSQ